MRVGIVGTGQIAQSYAKDLLRYDRVDLVGVQDRAPDRARALASVSGARAFESLDDLLSNGVDLVLNTTAFEAHESVTRACLSAGKHVYSEKPLAASPSQAWDLVTLARTQGVRLGCAPCTLLGEAQQTVRRLVGEGDIGAVRTVFAEAHGGRLERWHPAPDPFLAIGPLFDLAVYPLAILTAVLGPVRAISAHGRVLRPQRTTVHGTKVAVPVPDFVVAVITFDGGVLGRLTTSFDLPRHGAGNASIEFHGDDGSLRLSDWQRFDADVWRAAADEPEFASVPLDRRPEHEVENGRGILDMIEAITERRPHRCSAEHAAHLVDVLSAAARSVETGRESVVTTDFSRESWASPAVAMAGAAGAPPWTDGNR